MIKLFIADLDGCISFPFKTPDWGYLSAIRDYSEQSKKHRHIPPLSLCTGRPQPYVEAVAQWLDVRIPVIFESGGGIYHPPDNRIDWSPVYQQYKQEIDELKAWVQQNIVRNYPGLMREFTKKTDVGLVHPKAEVINEIYPIIRDHVENNYQSFDIHFTEVSVNIILSSSNKGTGVTRVAENLGIALDETAYIGDGFNDIPALEIVKYPFAPKNCRPEVAEIASVVDAEATEAVRHVYERIIDNNLNQSQH